MKNKDVSQSSGFSFARALRAVAYMMHMERYMSVSAMNCERKSCRDTPRRWDVCWTALRNLGGDGGATRDTGKRWDWSYVTM